LQKYKGDSNVHLELKRALEEYSQKEEWYKEFLEGCQKVAAVEVNKPAAERAAIPTAETGLVGTTGTGSGVDEEPAEEEEPKQTTPTRTRGRKRAAVSPGAEWKLKDNRKEMLEKKREDLEKVLSRRKSTSKRLSKDSICDKIQAQIDTIDEELMELIMS
jgi:hypothetical protein